MSLLAICLFVLRSISLPSPALLSITGNTIFQIPLTTNFRVVFASRGYWQKTGGWEEGEVKVFLPVPLEGISSRSCFSFSSTPTGHPFPPRPQLLLGSLHSGTCFSLSVLVSRNTTSWENWIPGCCLYLGCLIFPSLAFHVFLCNQFQY